MTKEQLALSLNGRLIGQEITEAEERTAKQEGLLVIFGASDDLCELRGAIYHEIGAPGDILIQDGVLLPEIEDDEAKVLSRHSLLEEMKKRRERALRVTACWCAVRGGPAWTYKTTAPHATFEVIEDGEVWCRGVVIDLKELERQ